MRVISRVTIRITHIRGLITPFMITHEPPSNIGVGISRNATGLTAIPALGKSFFQALRAFVGSCKGYKFQLPE